MTKDNVVDGPKPYRVPVNLPDIGVPTDAERRDEIASLRAENARLEALVAELEAPNMWWDEHSPEEGGQTPEEIADYHSSNIEPGDWPTPFSFSTLCARELPSAHYAVFPEPHPSLEGEHQLRLVKHSTLGEAMEATGELAALTDTADSGEAG